MVVCLVGDHLLGLGELEALDVHVLEGVVDVAHLLQELRCLIHSQDMHISTASGSCPGTSGSGGLWISASPYGRDDIHTYHPSGSQGATPKEWMWTYSGDETLLTSARATLSPALLSFLTVSLMTTEVASLNFFKAAVTWFSLLKWAFEISST